MSSGRHLEALDAELAVLGSIFLDNAAFDRVADVLSADDFYQARHKTIFEEMMGLVRAVSPSTPSLLRRH